MKFLVFAGKVLAVLAGILLLPYLLILLLLWSPIAWILGLIFPGRNFYPINKAWPVMNSWVDSKLGIDLNTIIFFLLVFIALGSVISWIAGLFSGKK